MKSYQHHDPVLDQGKALPHPKQPTRHTYRGGAFGGARPSFERQQYRAQRSASIKTEKGRSFQSLGIIGTLCAILGIRRKAGRR